MRTFIAIDLNPEIKETLSELIKELGKGSKNIKWISKQGMHLTLKFLGEISGEKVTEIGKILSEISGKYKPFLLKLKGTGYFPPEKKNPRVLWVGIEKEETLLALQSKVEAGLERLGFPREQRKFHPHLTLGRVKAPSDLRSTLSLLEAHREKSFGEMRVEKITFFQSVLKPQGAEYSIISEFGFK